MTYIIDTCANIEQFKLHSFVRPRDENAVAQSNLPAKTLHQRNKSTPALNSFASAKAISLNPLRRAAFADISNTRNPTVKDDGTSKAKNIALELKHFGPTQNDSAPAKPLQTVDVNPLQPKNLMRPLQRPQNAGIHKALPAAPVTSKPQPNGLSATTFSDISSLVDYAPIRKTIIKRHTTIFRETSVGSTAAPSVEAPVSVASEPFPSNTFTSLPEISQASSVAVVEPIQAIPVVEDVKEPVSSIVKPSLNSIAPSNLTLPSSNPIQAPISTEVAPIIVADTSVPEISAAREYLGYVNDEPQALEPELYLPALETQLPLLETTLLDEKVIQPQVITDLEEYWEEEIEEEFFDAEGCVTARSLRSMGGENTTSGMSTVIMPRVTSRVERELLAAKQWVEETGFAEITDDEAWDTTMVTEYGDEIFIYMRELEVCPMIHFNCAS
jgi:G2/mitotic-specific cyclin 3/4